VVVAAFGGYVSGMVDRCDAGQSHLSSGNFRSIPIAF